MNNQAEEFANEGTSLPPEQESPSERSESKMSVDELSNHSSGGKQHC